MCWYLNLVLNATNGGYDNITFIAASSASLFPFSSELRIVTTTLVRLLPSVVLAKCGISISATRCASAAPIITASSFKVVTTYTAQTNITLILHNLR